MLELVHVPVVLALLLAQQLIAALVDVPVEGPLANLCGSKGTTCSSTPTSANNGCDIYRVTAFVLDLCGVLAGRWWFVQVCHADETFSVVDFSDDFSGDLRNEVAPRRVIPFGHQPPHPPMYSWPQLFNETLL